MPYGCDHADAVYRTYVASVDPAVRRIDDGKPYLSYNAAIHQSYAGDIPGFIARIETNWPN